METPKRGVPRDSPGDEDGFTIVELMVVVFIIGVLIAIALPTFLGFRTRAEDRTAQEDLRTGLVAGLGYYSQTRDWTDFDAGQARSEEPNIDWLDAGPPGLGEISIHIHSDQELLLIRLSKSGTYFCLAQVAMSPATDSSRGTTFTDVDTLAECTGGW